MKLILGFVVLVSCALTASPQSAGNVQKLLANEATRLRTWGTDPAIVAAVKSQNAQRVPATLVTLLDEQWTAGKADLLVKRVLTSPCANHLRSLLRAAHGETFVMDDQGALVCATAKTTDYWQGDEAKWQRAFNAGGGVFIDRPKFDASSGQRLAQISVPVLDKGVAIGAITVGVAIDKLQK